MRLGLDMPQPHPSYDASTFKSAKKFRSAENRASLPLTVRQ